MTAARERDVAVASAAAGYPNALAHARGVHVPWYRAQALAAVAWYADDGWMDAARESLAAAGECENAYARAAVRAWPLRVLLDRGGPGAAAPAFEQTMRDVAAIDHPVSRADAAALLLQAVAPYDAGMRTRMAEALADAASQARSWKAPWHLRNAALLVGQWDRALASRLAAAIAGGSYQRQAELGIAAAEWDPPRWFFAPR